MTPVLNHTSLAAAPLPQPFAHIKRRLSEAHRYRFAWDACCHYWLRATRFRHEVLTAIDDILVAGIVGGDGLGILAKDVGRRR